MVDDGDADGDGAHSITASDTDAAGNVGTSAAVLYTLDTLAPVVAISSVGGQTNAPSQTISGTVTPANANEAAVGSTVTLYDNTIQIGTATVVAPITDGAPSTWSTTVTLTGDGAHSITASDTDAAGNVGTSSATVYTLDTQPPVGHDHQRRRRDDRCKPDNHRNGVGACGG